MRFLFCSFLFAIFQTCCLAETENAIIPVVNLTSLPDTQDYLQGNLAQSVKDIVKEHGLTLVIASASEKYVAKYNCWVWIGLTHQTGSDKINPREPVRKYVFFSSAPESGKGDEECLESAFHAAVSQLNGDTKERILENTDETELSGATYKERGQKDDTMVRHNLNLARWQSGTQAVTDDQVLQDIYASPFAKAFDYRDVMLHFVTEEFNLQTNIRVCVAWVGLAPTVPDNRAGRIPSVQTSQLWLGKNENISEQECVAHAAKGALAKLIAMPWNEFGMLKRYSRTKEAGINLPDYKRAEQLHKGETVSR